MLSPKILEKDGPEADRDACHAGQRLHFMAISVSGRSSAFAIRYRVDLCGMAGELSMRLKDGYGIPLSLATAEIPPCLSMSRRSFAFSAIPFPKRGSRP
jgi:hypothetical protein